MALRSSMAALIARVRILINDPAGANQQFADTDIQDVLDESRVDYVNEPLKPSPTFGGSTIRYLDYFHDLGGWEDNPILKQYLVTVVTPSASEPIVGHWQFATTTLPPVFITGALHDVYRASADLLDRLAMRWALSYDIGVDGQNLRRSQVVTALQKMAQSYRTSQRASSLIVMRSDLQQPAGAGGLGLGAHEIDYMGSG